MAAADFADFLQQDVQGDFTPRPFYEAATDSLIFYVRDERSYAKQINDQFSLFLSVADDSFVGVEFNGLARFVSDAEEEHANYVPDPETEGMTLEEYMAWAVKKHGHRKFEPCAFYNIEGNHIDIVWDDESDYGDGYGAYTLMRGQDTKKAVGIKIYGIKQLLQA